MATSPHHCPRCGRPIDAFTLAGSVTAGCTCATADPAPAEDRPGAIFPCPCCKHEFDITAAAGPTAACPSCRKQWRLGDCFRKAVILACANDGWIERIFWHDYPGCLTSLVLIPLDTAWTFMHRFAGWLFLLVLGFIVFAGPDGLGGAGYALFAVAIGAAYASLFVLRRFALPRLTRRIAGEPFVLMCSRGVIDIGRRREPLLLPWHAVVRADFAEDMGGYSQICITYRTAAGGTATVAIQGSQGEQSMGEILDVLSARIAGSRVTDSTI